MTARPAMFAGAAPSRVARAAIAPVVAAFLSACGGSTELEEEAASTAAAPAYAGTYPSAATSALVFEQEGDEPEPFDEDAPREEAEDEIAGESYAGIGMPYGCTVSTVD